MLLISQLSKMTGVPVHTIRYYEKYGLFKGKKDPHVSSNNYLRYNEEDVDKLELIKEAKDLGFSLSEMKSLIDAWYGRRLSVEKKTDILLDKIKEIDGKIAHLKRMKKMLGKAIAEVRREEC
jgi:MerR family Zn(II)-responsive transcriptional regulator of zntA